jgi:CheY-like chemotaxis protein
LPTSEGVEATRELRRLAPNSSLILTTGDTGAQVEERARKAGLPIVYKPISAEKLRRLIAYPTLV